MPFTTLQNRKSMDRLPHLYAAPDHTPTTTATTQEGQHHQHSSVQPYTSSSSSTTTTLLCARDLVGRVIGRGGTTVKGIQRFTGAVIQVDQRLDPSTITILGEPESVCVARSIICDIMAGNFKGFALLRQLVASKTFQESAAKQYVYAPGLGLFPQWQQYAAASFTSTANKAARDSLKDDCDTKKRAPPPARKSIITTTTTATTTPPTLSPLDLATTYLQLVQQQ